MANFVEELIDALVTQGVATAKGTDIFYNELPEDSDLSPATMMVLKDTSGVPALGQPTPTMIIQALVRSADGWTTARTKAAEIYTFYHTHFGRETTNFHITRSVAVQMPYDLGLDERKRSLISFNLEFEAYALDQDDDDGDGGFGGKGDLYDPFLP